MSLEIKLAVVVFFFLLGSCRQQESQPVKSTQPNEKTETRIEKVIPNVEVSNLIGTIDPEETSIDGEGRRYYLIEKDTQTDRVVFEDNNTGLFRMKIDGKLIDLRIGGGSKHSASYWGEGITVKLDRKEKTEALKNHVIREGSMYVKKENRYQNIKIKSGR